MTNNVLTYIHNKCIQMLVAVLVEIVAWDCCFSGTVLYPLLHLLKIAPTLSGSHSSFSTASTTWNTHWHAFSFSNISNVAQCKYSLHATGWCLASSLSLWKPPDLLLFQLFLLANLSNLCFNCNLSSLGDYSLLFSGWAFPQLYQTLTHQKVD
jgi:hypothetical protein